MKMKQKENLIFLIFLMILISCGTAKQKSVNNLEEAIVGEKLSTLSGIYESRQGVMANISCYCYKVGYLTTSDNMPIVVCFDELEKSDEVKCDGKMTVSGKFKKIKIQPEETNPCPEGEMEVFMVESYICE